MSENISANEYKEITNMMQKYIHSIGQTVKFEEEKDFELEI
jgi:hypothetical protein